MNTQPSPTKPFWFRFLPARIRERVVNRPGVLQILSNIGWLFSDRILRLVIGLAVGVWLARYLGPEDFGLFNFAMAFISMFGALASLGLNGVVVRDLVKKPEDANSTLGTAFILRVVSGFLALGMSVLVVSLVRPDDDLVKAIVAILGFGMIAKAAEVVKFWFESQVRSKYTVWVENGVFLLMAAVRIVLILSQAPLVFFAWAALVEVAVVSVLLMIIYGRFGGRLSLWRWKFQRGITLVKESWPLILSGIAAIVYMRVDQIMLGQMIGDEAVGIYSVAVRLSEVWYFVPFAIVASVYPSIIKAKERDESEYSKRWQALYDVAVLISLLVAVPASLLAEPVITLLFGSAYASSADVFAVHIWTGLFVFLGVASAKWFVIENRQFLSFQRTLLGAVLNVMLNVYMIPKYGAVGAAYATLLAQATAAFLFDALRRDTRRMFLLKLRSMNIVAAIGRVW